MLRLPLLTLGPPSKLVSHTAASKAVQRAVYTAPYIRGISVQAITADNHVDFDDISAAYKSQNLATLIRSYSVLQICQYGALVRNSSKLIDLSYTLLGSKITNRMMELTFFSHFCGGEDAVGVEKNLQSLTNSNIGAILAYAAECDVQDTADIGGSKHHGSTPCCQNDAYCDLNMDATRRAVTLAGRCGSGTSFAAVKLTALGRPDFLEAMSKKLVRSNLSLSDCLASMNENEITQYNNMINRVKAIANTAQEMGVSLLIDAEQTYMQPVIDRVAVDLQRSYNKDTPVVYNTYQCYRKDTYKRAKQDLEYAKNEGWIFAAKFVRGAYMVQERARAAQMGYEDPIQDTLHDTHANYNRCVQTALQNIAYSSVVVATHNEESVQRAVQQMQALGIPRKGGGVHFGQLLGMRDHITYNLGREGFEAFKYVPYGPIHEVLPYLIRRAEENSDIMTSAQTELAQLKAEIVNRLLPGV